MKLGNLLPKNGQVEYYGKVFSEKKASEYYVKLLNEINWQNDVVKIFGKEIVTKRKVALYGDTGINYKYSGKIKTAEKWTNLLTEIKSLIEEISGETYNACLLNLYHNGLEAMSWHADNEKEMLENSAIASISFGAERKFGFRHKTSQEEISLILENGSLLVMKGETQEYWKHKLFTNSKVKEARVNLTFRKIIPNYN